jgi:hypothetical protein
MRDHFNASMYFLLATAFAICAWHMSNSMALWKPPALNVIFLSLNCLLVMAKNLGLNCSIFTRPRFIWALFFANIGIVLLATVLDMLHVFRV